MYPSSDAATAHEGIAPRGVSFPWSLIHTYSDVPHPVQVVEQLFSKYSIRSNNCIKYERICSLDFFSNYHLINFFYIEILSLFVLCLIYNQLKIVESRLIWFYSSFLFQMFNIKILLYKEVSFNSLLVK